MPVIYYVLLCGKYNFPSYVIQEKYLHTTHKKKEKLRKYLQKFTKFKLKNKTPSSVFFVCFSARTRTLSHNHPNQTLKKKKKNYTRESAAATAIY